MVRDLWENRDLPHKDVYEVTIPARGCVVYRISKKSTALYDKTHIYGDAHTPVGLR